MQNLTWSPLLPAGLIWITTILIGGLALISAWRTRNSWPLWSNLCALGMRTIAVACAVVLVFRPVGIQKETRSQRASLIVLVDSSQSLNLRDGSPKRPGPTRAQQGQSSLAQLLQEARKRKWELHAFNIGKKLETRTLQSSVIQTTSPISPLGDLLDAAFHQVSSQAPHPPGAVVFFTDGCVNTGRPLKISTRALADRSVPLFGVLLGRKSPQAPDAVISDLTIRRAKDESENGTQTFRAGEHLIVEARAWLNAPGRYKTILKGPLATTMVHLHLRAPGTEESNTLNKARPFVRSNNLKHQLRQAPGWTQIRLRFRPKLPGHYRLRLSLEPFEDEQNFANNIAFGSIVVEPTRRHTLYISSQLGHDYRKLKVLFAQWNGPRVEMVSDFIKPLQHAGATPSWPAEHVLSRMLSPSASSNLRPGNIIWEEPDLTHLSNRTQTLLRAAIAAGELGILWVVNEPANLVKAKLKNSPLEDTFLFRKLTAPAHTSGQEWDPVLPTHTELTDSHPITNWASKQSTFEMAPWQNLGPTRVWGYFTDPRASTKVLLTAGNRPLLSVGMVEQGKVALLTTGESWRWLTPQPHAPVRRHAPALARELWLHLCQWLSGSGSTQPEAVRLFLSKNRWDWELPLNASISVRPSKRDSKIIVEMSLTKLTDASQSSPKPRWFEFGSDTGIIQSSDTGREGSSNHTQASTHLFTGQTKPITSVGEWLVRVRAKRSDGSVIGYDRERITVTGASLEAGSRIPDKDALEAAVKAGGPGGAVFLPVEKDMNLLIGRLEKRLRIQKFTSERTVSAINQGAFLFLLLLALSVDAWLRRG